MSRYFMKQREYLQRECVLVDIDVQKHFFLAGSRFCVRNQRIVLANILRIIHWAHMNHIRIISTVQDLGSYCRFLVDGSEGQKKIPQTLLERYISFDATDNTDLLLPEIFDKYKQVIFCKRHFDPFMEPRADRMLSECCAGEFILIGALAEGAVRATALGLLARRENVTIVIDAVGSCNKTTKETVLQIIKERGAKLVRAETIFKSYQPDKVIHINT